MTGGSNLQPPSEGPMVWRHRRRWELYSQIKTNIPHAQTQTRRGDARTTKPKRLPQTRQSIKRANPLPLLCETNAKPSPLMIKGELKGV